MVPVMSCSLRCFRPLFLSFKSLRQDDESAELDDRNLSRGPDHPAVSRPRRETELICRCLCHRKCSDRQPESISVNAAAFSRVIMREGARQIAKGVCLGEQGIGFGLESLYGVGAGSEAGAVALRARQALTHNGSMTLQKTLGLPDGYTAGKHAP